MKKLLLCFLILALTHAGLGQNTFRRNTLYGQILGNGILLSINYERQLMNKPGLGVRLGVGYASTDEKFRPTIPIGVNYLVNLRNYRSFFDVGIGATWAQEEFMKVNTPAVDENNYIVSLVPSIGYRHQSKWGLMWRIGFAPIINKSRFIPFPELSLGMSFR